MVATVQGNLLILNAHTTSPKVLWKGEELTDVVAISIKNDADTHRVRLWVTGPSLLIHNEMRAEDIRIVRTEV